MRIGVREGWWKRAQSLAPWLPRRNVSGTTAQCLTGESTLALANLAHEFAHWSQSQLNDVFLEWALHNASWDYTNPDGTDQGKIYREKFGSYADRTGLRRGRVTVLEVLDLEKRRFVVPAFLAPQRWGYNLVRLIGDMELRTSLSAGVFYGLVDAKTGADPAYGAKRTAPSPEVTSSGPYSFRP